MLDASRAATLVLALMAFMDFARPLAGEETVPGAPAAPAASTTAQSLVGVWESKRSFGPAVRGTLLVERVGGTWRAEIAGRSAVPGQRGDRVAFELSDAQGGFEGRLEKDAAGKPRISGFWRQPVMVTNGMRFASPVVLSPLGVDRYAGPVAPLDDEMTLYLVVQASETGIVSAFLRNPERNAGRFLTAERVERQGETIRLLGGADKQSPLLADGVLRDDVLTLLLPSQGGAYDFRRVPPGGPTDLYPRSRPSVPYVYRPPVRLDDGWPTASLEEVGLSREALTRFVQMLIDTPIDSPHAQEMHAVLIARHGKLVLEEYFHGEHRDKPHDTRSASKSLAATLMGAAIQAGVKIEPSTPVQRLVTSAEGTPVDPLRQALTLEHLLTMSSGLDCDDADDGSPGNENTMQEQTRQPDWVRYTLDLKMIRPPGAKAVYCSVNANLLGALVQRAAARPLGELFRDRIAAPLHIGRYFLNLTPTGEVYMGGGIRFLPRDFMKLGQLHLSGGVWNGKRVLPASWVKRATSPLVTLGASRYGYFWWVSEYPYRGRMVKAFYAAGNGGQIVMAFPELDLVVAFFGGSYADRTALVPQRDYVPRDILPAVAER
ncbi:MAG: serine hydrolase [Thermoanaerobaculia bacterium]